MALLNKIAPAYATTMEKLGRAMLEVARNRPLMRPGSPIPDDPMDVGVDRASFVIAAVNDDVFMRASRPHGLVGLGTAGIGNRIVLVIDVAPGIQLEIQFMRVVPCHVSLETRVLCPK